jgi:hypothetical protein
MDEVRPEPIEQIRQRHEGEWLLIKVTSHDENGLPKEGILLGHFPDKEKRRGMPPRSLTARSMCFSQVQLSLRVGRRFCMVGFRFDLSAPHIVVPVRITGAQRVEWLGFALDTGSNQDGASTNWLPFGSDTTCYQHPRFHRDNRFRELAQARLIRCPPNFCFGHSGGRISRLGHATANTVARRRSFGLRLFEASELVLQL